MDYEDKFLLARFLNWSFQVDDFSGACVGDLHFFGGIHGMPLHTI